MAEYIPNNGWGGLSKYNYEDHRHMPLFLINKHLPPDNFRYGYTEDTEQLVKSQRNSQGVVVAKKVGAKYGNYKGQRLLKFNNLEWPYLPEWDYRWLQEQIEKFYCYVTYWDHRAGLTQTSESDYSVGVQTTGGFVTKKFYWGDFSAEPYEFYRDTDHDLLVPASYINVKVNLIDCGEPYLSKSDPNWCDPHKYHYLANKGYQGSAPYKP